MSGERKFKIEFKRGKEDVKESVSATGHAEAVRKLFPKAGELRFQSAEIVRFYFEADFGNGEVIKGEVRQARRSKPDGTEETE